MTTKRIPGPAGTIEIQDEGTGGIPVVFLHGFSGNRSHWAAQLEHLRATRRVLAMDLRAHGGSDHPADGDYAVESQGADVVAVLDAAGLERAVLVGHSLGGAIAIAVAGAEPERLAGLVLVSSPGKVPDEQAAQIIDGMESDYDTTSAGFWEQLTKDARPEVAEQLAREQHDLDPETGLAIIKATFAFDPLPLLERYRGPKLAIVTPRGDAPHDLHNAADDLPHRVVPGTSHFIQLDAPDAVNAILDEFLASLD